LGLDDGADLCNGGNTGGLYDNPFRIDCAADFKHLRPEIRLQRTADAPAGQFHHISALTCQQITVDAKPDIIFDPIPEGIEPGDIVGKIDLIGGGNNPVIDIDDPRFGLRDDDIIFIGGDIDYEGSPVIPITITITDTDTGEVIEQTIAVHISDKNDPIEDIVPHEVGIREEIPGAEIKTLIVIDQDVDDEHTLSVDDSRFVIEDSVLKLAEGVELDFEKEQLILINVTATDSGGDSHTQEIKVHVLNTHDQLTAIELSNETVMELVPGETVGEVSTDGGSAGTISLTVDDPRFEIDGTTLKLVDDQHVVRANQSEIELTITAEDTSGQLDSLSQDFIIEVLENVTPYHNYKNPYDVDKSGEVSTLDALLIINYLNRFGPGPVERGTPGYCLDVNGDGLVTALDALLVLNEINRRITIGEIVGGEGEPEGEGEPIPTGEIDEGSKPLDDSIPQPHGHPGDKLFKRMAGHAATPLDPSAGSGRSTDPIESPSESSVDDYARSVDLLLLSEKPS